MSASREKQLRQERANSGWVDPKTVRDEEQRKKEKRSNTLYGIIAIVFVVAIIVAGIWRSNVIGKTATAATIDGEKYTAAEVNFYYQNVYQSFLSNNYYFVSYIGLDTSASLKDQTINETAASWMGAEEGQTWHEYFLNAALNQMASVQTVLAAAEEEGYTYSAGVQAQYDDSMASLQESAASSSVSASQYLKNIFGGEMTEKVYSEQLMRVLQYDEYTSTYYNGLTYSDNEINAAYEADRISYDQVAYEVVAVPGVAESTTDADGNTVEPTEEEAAAALEAAEKAADEMLEAYLAGEDLESLSEADDSYVYTKSDGIAYSGDVVTEWLFDDSRKANDSAVLEYGSTYYVVVFLERYRDEAPTIDVRHILIEPQAGTLAEGEEGYEEEQAQLMADAVAYAEDLLNQWKAGEATEDSFAELAMQESSDGSKYVGGLYTGVYEGQMVTAFNDWCFDSSRKPGDTDVVETEYGAHVMYFVNRNLPYWQMDVVTDLRDAAYNEWLSNLSADCSITRHDSGMKFVG